MPLPTNYIKRLEMQVKLMADEIVARENRENALIVYLQSDKFNGKAEHLKGYVHVEDVLLRLRENLEWYRPGSRDEA